jgi:PAS domain S-box-containing protein
MLPFSPFKRGSSLPLVLVGLVGLALTGTATWLAEHAARNTDDLRFGHAQEHLRMTVDQLTRQFEYGLRGIRALWPASKSVERGEFLALLQERNLGAEFPGVRGVGFIRRVARPELAGFLAATRADGSPEFQLPSPGAAGELYVGEFVQPVDGPARAELAEGFDFATLPAARVAADQAMLSGELTLSTPIFHPTEPPGLLFVLPIYRNGAAPLSPEERRGALLGWSYVLVSTPAMFLPMAEELNEEIDFKLFAALGGADPALLFDTAAALPRHANAADQRAYATAPLSLGGQNWTLAYRPSAHFAITSRLGIYGSAVGGVLLTLLVTGLLHSYKRTTQNAREIAAELTTHLSASLRQTERLALVATRTSNAIVFTDAQRRITWVNEGFTRMTGYTATESLGKKPGAFLQSPRTDPAMVQAMRAAFDRGEAFQGEVCNRRKDGQDYWVTLDVIPLHDEAGQLSGFMATKLDVSASKASEARLALEVRRAESALDELRQTESQLQQKATRLSLATQVGGIGIWEWDVTTNSLLWDATMRTLYGLPGDAPVDAYEAWGKALHPEDAARCHQEIREAVADIRPFDTEFRIIWPDGTIHHLRARAVVQRADEGQPLRMIGVNWDLTALKTSQERLQLFSRAVDQSPASVVITNTRGEIEYVNEKFTRLTGYTLPEVVGKNPRVLKSGATTAENYREMWATISRGEVWSGVFHNQNKAGELYWEAATITPIKTASGQISHYLASKEDITERRRAEAALRHERWLLNSLMATAPAHIYFQDRSGAFLQINPAFARFLGVAAPEAVVGLTAFDVFSAESAQQSRLDDETVMASGRPLIGKIERSTLRDGTSRWFSTSKMPLLDDAGTLTGTFGFSLDVSAQKQSEEDRALLLIQLSQAQKLESIGMLASGIAHEINTPAQFVSDNLAYVAKGMTKLEPVLAAFPQVLAALEASGGQPPALAALTAPLAHLKFDHLRRELPSALEDALNGMGRITQIVRAMKSFSHPGGDKLNPCDLNQAIDNTLIVCRNEWKYVAELQTELAPDLPLVPCQLGDFNQVIVNLVVNAAHAIADVVQANPGSKGLITVSTRLLDGWAEVRVADTGTGIPESARAHIFTPFFTTKQVGKGTGQGLALSRSVIAERHHGTLHFETELGRGTTFIIRLPLVAVETTPPRTKPAPAPS